MAQGGAQGDKKTNKKKSGGKTTNIDVSSFSNQTVALESPDGSMLGAFSDHVGSFWKACVLLETWKEILEGLGQK